MTRLVPRTRLTYRDGAYYVGAPNYEPGEVVTDADAQRLEAVVKIAERLCALVEEEIRSHAPDYYSGNVHANDCEAEECLWCSHAKRYAAAYRAALAALKEAK